MSQLYKITDEEFSEWLNSNPSEDDLREAYLILEAKRHALWSLGTEDSYFRDRFERDERYVKRLVAIKDALVKVWWRTGQVNLPNIIDAM